MFPAGKASYPLFANSTPYILPNFSGRAKTCPPTAGRFSAIRLAIAVASLLANSDGYGFPNRAKG
jgi:hypothetical protein